MKTRLSLCLFFLVALAPCAFAQQPTAATPPNDQSKPLVTVAPLPLAPIATQLGQTIQTLVGVPSSQPAPVQTTPSTNEDLTAPVADTFATSLLDTLAQSVDILKAKSTNWGAAVSAWPDFMDWLNRQMTDTRRQDLWNAIGNDLLIIVGAPLLIGIALELFLLPFRTRMKRKEPNTLPRRVGLLASLLFMGMIPLFVFLGLALLLLDQNETHKLPRFVILNVIYALSLGYTLRQCLRAAFAPTASHLRLFKLSTAHAVSLYRWLSTFCFVIIYGYFFVDVAAAMRVPPNAIIVFQNIFGLILTAMAIQAVLRTRTPIAKIVRGTSASNTESFSLALRGWLAGHWHTLTIAYLVIGFIVSLLGIDNGVEVLLRGTILTFIVLLATRLCLVTLDQWKAPASNGATLIHRQLLSFVLRPLIWITATIAIAATWGLRIRDLIGTPAGQKTTSALLSIGITLAILTVIYEIFNTSIDRHLSRREEGGTAPVASPRARTLLPMIRNTVFILFCSVAILTCLTAVGINIGPLLAGAGVVGVAIGFGSQTLVKDFLTGLFIVAENTISVGDIVKIGDFGGVVETLSIRTIRLRDSDGSLHILPFSEVTKITNRSKGFGYALVDIAVSYDSDLEHVMSVLREVGAQIQEDPIFKRVILEPIEVMGVENLGDSSITIRARIRTRPNKQWDVRRLLLLRIKQRFDQEKIEIPFPTVTHVVKSKE